MNPNHSDEERARARFFTIQALRLSGVALTVLGVAVIAGKIPFLPEIAGYALVLVGVTDALVVPPFLTRMWRTPLP
ncbi:MAG: hypothetical protein M0R03_11800 [Novosphingobium sp.]|nr:hypothetical protein [Novosphingobium sp.]